MTNYTDIENHNYKQEAEENLVLAALYLLFVLLLLVVFTL